MVNKTVSLGTFLFRSALRTSCLTWAAIWWRIPWLTKQIWVVWLVYAWLELPLERLYNNVWLTSFRNLHIWVTVSMPLAFLLASAVVKIMNKTQVACHCAIHKRVQQSPRRNIKQTWYLREFQKFYNGGLRKIFWTTQIQRKHLSENNCVQLLLARLESAWWWKRESIVFGEHALVLLW